MSTTSNSPIAKTVETNSVKRLNYIGSKYQLMEWIDESIKKYTGWTSYNDRVIGDVFSGTGIVSYYFRKQLAVTLSNDAELYSYYITKALTCCTYTRRCERIIERLNKYITMGRHHGTVGFVTRNYSPYEDCERMFFTVDNAQRIDFLRSYIEKYKNQSKITNDEYIFVVASLLWCVDSISNVPAVYGCYLKNFKNTSLKPLVLQPIHKDEILPSPMSQTTNYNVLADDFRIENADLVYIDPPYNERQYSKNYFPLNVIAMTPAEQQSIQIKGKTGIPENSFVSPFCQVRQVKDAFKNLISKHLHTRWIALSYNSESLISKDDMIKLITEVGGKVVGVEEMDYKRFKSFQYNDDKKIQEYLFIVQMS